MPHPSPNVNPFSLFSQSFCLPWQSLSGRPPDCLSFDLFSFTDPGLRSGRNAYFAKSPIKSNKNRHHDWRLMQYKKAPTKNEKKSRIATYTVKGSVSEREAWARLISGAREKY